MPYLTLSGIDEHTAIQDLVPLVEAGVELGVLYTFSSDHRHRYPSLLWIVDLVKVLPRGSVAVHVCGARARSSFLRGMPYLTDHVRRVQVNGCVRPSELRSICEGLPEHTIITQHVPANEALVDADLPNHALLVDSSGGRGLLPDQWVRPDTEKMVGFAGGLSPANLRVQLPRIAAVARGEWWIDLEGKLRDSEDWFSVEKAEEVLRIWVEGSPWR